MNNILFILALLLFSVLPALLLLPLYIRYSSEEPIVKGLALKSIVLGIMFTLPASFIQWSLPWLLAPLGITLNNIIHSFIIVAFPEEVAKLLALLILRHSTILGGRKVDINLIFPAFLMGIGFSLTENIFYMLASHSPLHTAFVRSITALPVHTLSAGIIALSLLPPSRRPFNVPPFAGLLFAIILHGLYDLILKQHKIHKGFIFPLLLLAWILLLHSMNTSHKKYRN